MKAGWKVPKLRTSEKAPGAPRQRRSIEKRRKLLEAGRLLFGEKGYEAASIEDITSKAGTSAGSFYQYFCSKRQFLVVLMSELVQRLSSLELRPAGGANVQSGLREFLAAVFRVDVAYFGVVRAWQEAALADAELNRMQKEIEAWTGARILGVFERLRQHPDARREGDLSTFARMMDGHFWWLLARGSNMPRQKFDREVRVAADVIYHYLFCDSAARRV